MKLRITEALRCLVGLGVVLWLLGVAGCASPGPLACPAGAQAAQLDTLYFGTARRDAPAVTMAEWRDFLERVIVPRFPGGLTWWQAQGVWNAQDGVSQRETTYVLQLVHPPGAAISTSLAEIMRHYRERFAQEAVLHLASSTCMSL